MLPLCSEGFLNIAGPPALKHAFHMPVCWLRANLAKENTATSREQEEGTHGQRAPLFAIHVRTFTRSNQGVAYIYVNGWYDTGVSFPKVTWALQYFTVQTSDTNQMAPFFFHNGVFTSLILHLTFMEHLVRWAKKNNTRLICCWNWCTRPLSPLPVMGLVHCPRPLLSLSVLLFWFCELGPTSLSDEHKLSMHGRTAPGDIRILGSQLSLKSVERTGAGPLGFSSSNQTC